MHRSIAGPDAAVMIGDSITEGFYWNKIGDCTVVNAGFGGISAANMAKYTDVLLQGGAPKYAIIMLGSNPDKDMEKFRKGYIQIVDRLSRAGTTVIIVNIPPVEPEKLVVKRSMDAISAMNRIIRDEIAAPRGLEYVDLYGKMTINGKAAPNTTIDGIHFSPDSYRVEYKLLDAALQHQIALTGKICAE